MFIEDMDDDSAYEMLVDGGVSSYETQYLELAQKILDEGEWIDNERTGRKCLTIPSHTFEYGEEIPLLTTRPSYPVSAWAEMLGYLRRYEWANQFADIGSPTWDVNSNHTEAWLVNPNRIGHNHIGKCYGAALGDYELPELFDKLNRHVDDRGLMINFWKPEKFELGCLRPCMYRHLFTILGDTLYLESSQRSCDYMCGKNFNALQVWFLLKHACKITGLKFGGAKHHIVNIHIYDKHINGVKELLRRTPTELDVNFRISEWVKSFEDLTENDTHAREYFKLEGYSPQPKIDFELVA